MLSILLALSLGAVQPAATPVATPAAPAFQLEPYQLVVLQRPASPRDYPKEKLEEIQAAHLGHMKKMAEAGKLVVAGPLGDQPAPRWRGLALYRVGSLDEARKLAEEDPAVKAGRLEVLVMTWFTEKGAMEFPIAKRMAAPQ